MAESEPVSKTVNQLESIVYFGSHETRFCHLLHMASTSALVMVGARFLKKIEVVLCKARGWSLPSSSASPFADLTSSPF